MMVDDRGETTTWQSTIGKGGYRIIASTYPYRQSCPLTEIRQWTSVILGCLLVTTYYLRRTRMT